MTPTITRRSQKTGLPAGTLVHLGPKKTQPVKITMMHYDEYTFSEQENCSLHDCFLETQKSGVTWISVNGVHQIEIIQELGELFQLHPLTLEDILSTDQRPKIEAFDSYTYLVLRAFFYHEKNHETPLSGDQLSIILGPRWVISFTEGENDLFDPVRARLRSGAGRIRRMRSDYLAYSLIDSVVDNYFSVLELLEDKIEHLEDILLANPGPETLQTIHSIKTEMIFLRKSLWPLREIISRLERGESAFVTDAIRIYLRDVYDHTIQVIDSIETFRDILSGMLDIHLSSISNRINSVMKVLTVIATIFMPLTFIAGVYGMNFKYMPELESPWGYPAVLLVMTAISSIMLIYFRRKKWV